MSRQEAIAKTKTDDPKPVEAMYLQDEQELRRVIDLTPQTIIVLNPDGKAIYANRIALEYTGLSLDEVLADDFRERVFHPEDIQRVRELRQKGLSRTSPFENEQRARHVVRLRSDLACSHSYSDVSPAGLGLPKRGSSFTATARHKRP